MQGLCYNPAMFWPDVIALKAFYSSPLGLFTSHAITRKLRRVWPEAKDEVMLGLGFALPYLTPYMAQAERIIACMPAQQGVVHWPPQARNLSLLTDEAELPLPDNSIHRVLVVHALENSEHTRNMLSEIWRVLTPTGRLLVVVPNRLGVWARSPASPFAYGHPYLSGQLKQMLSEHSFTPLWSSSALFFPPSERRFMLRSARFLEAVGEFFFPAFGGVLMIEAEKRIYAPIMQQATRATRKLYVPAGQSAQGI